MITNKKIDNGSSFDFGMISQDYARYRDIYELGFYHKSQKLLDIGTGSGVFPRKMYKYGY